MIPLGPSPWPAQPGGLPPRQRRLDLCTLRRRASRASSLPSRRRRRRCRRHPCPSRERSLRSPRHWRVVWRKSSCFCAYRQPQPISHCSASDYRAQAGLPTRSPLEPLKIEPRRGASFRSLSRAQDVVRCCKGPHLSVSLRAGQSLFNLLPTPPLMHFRLIAPGLFSPSISRPHCLSVRQLRLQTGQRPPSDEGRTRPQTYRRFSAPSVSLPHGFAQLVRLYAHFLWGAQNR